MKRMLAAGVLVLLGFLPAEDTKQYSDWSLPENLGPMINSKYIDSCVAISKDGLSLYFSSTRDSSPPTNNWLRSLYVSRRASKTAPWEAPVPLTMLNTASWQSCPALSLDEHLLFFASDMQPGCGDYDFWVSRRHDRRDDSGWGPPVNLGCEKDGYVNSEHMEATPAFFEDETGRILRYFSRFEMVFHLYQSEMRDDDTFGPPTLLDELNSGYGDTGPAVRRDGLEIIFGSKRPGGSGIGTSFDFWSATRESTSDPWSKPVFVPSLGNPALMQGRIALSFDGCELYFTSIRKGGSGLADFWVARRERVRGKK